MGQAKRSQNNAQELSHQSCSVKWFNLKRGYGFLEFADQQQQEATKSPDIFMHFSLLEEAGFSYVSPGDLIVCDIRGGEQGYHVKKIHSVNANATPSQEISLVLQEKMGTVRWFNILRGYGFIKPDDGQKDIFMHTGSLKEIRVDRLLPGQRVKAKVLLTERGREAREVRLIEDAFDEDFDTD
jgi:CspA family cold shock protein